MVSLRKAGIATLLLFLLLLLVSIAAAQPVQIGNSTIWPDANKNNVTAIAGQPTGIVPALNLTRWGNTTFLRIIPVWAAVWTNIANNNGVVTVSATNLNENLTALNDGSGFDLNITLTAKPVSNSFPFGITSAGLTFNYQSPLNATYSIGQMHGPYRIDAVTQTTVSNNTIGTMVSANPNLIGSYMVYTNNTGDFTSMGGYNFRSGKVFQILPPIIYDRTGNRSVTTMTFASNIITIIAPFDFLNQTNLYPMTIDPTFGYTTVPTYSTETTYSGYTYAYNTSVKPASSGTLTDIFVYCNASQVGVGVQAGLYSNGTNDLPASRLIYNSTNNDTAPTGNNPVWKDVYLPAGYSVVGGTSYWLATVTNLSTLNVPFDNVAKSNTFVNAVWPASYGTPTTQNAAAGIYGVYTATGGGGFSPVDATFACSPTVIIRNQTVTCTNATGNNIPNSTDFYGPADNPCISSNITATTSRNIFPKNFGWCSLCEIANNGGASGIYNTSCSQIYTMNPWIGD